MPDFRLTDEETAALLALIQAPARGGVEVPAPLTAWGARRAERYLMDRLACLGCHAWRGEGGAIGPPLDGIARRVDPSAIAPLVHDPGASRPGSSMPPSLFRPGILEEVVALLAHDDREWSAPESATVPWPERRAVLTAAVVAGSLPTGRDLYRLRCAHCHGTRGDGAGFNANRLPVAPTAHSDSLLMSLRPDDTLYDGIAAGGWVLDRSHRMPAFRESLTRDQIRSLVAYIRELCGCAAPEWAGREAPR
jgi:mono/diheme cytochrome c family protein